MLRKDSDVVHIAFPDNVMHSGIAKDGIHLHSGEEYGFGIVQCFPQRILAPRLGKAEGFQLRDLGNVGFVHSDDSHSASPHRIL